MHAYITIAGVPGDAWVREGESCKRYAVRASDSRPDTHKKKSDRTHKKDEVVPQKKAGEDKKQPWQGYLQKDHIHIHDDW